MNVTAGLGIFVGSAAGAAIAEQGGDIASYALISTICLSTFAILQRVSIALDAV
jgi:hypothetical protein